MNTLKRYLTSLYFKFFNLKCKTSGFCFTCACGDNNCYLNFKVLPDGTIVRTNKTYSTSEDGTSFFSFQSTSFNSFGHSTDNESDVEIEDNAEEVEDGDTVVEETVSDEIPSQKEYEDIEEEREELEENVGVDEGLFNA